LSSYKIESFKYYCGSLFDLPNIRTGVHFMSQYNNAMSYARNLIAAAALGTASIGAAYAQQPTAHSAASTVASQVNGTNYSKKEGRYRTLEENHTRRANEEIVQKDWAKFRVQCVNDPKGNKYRIWLTEAYTPVHLKNNPGASNDGLRSIGEHVELYASRDTIAKAIGDSNLSALEQKCAPNKEWDGSKMFKLTDGGHKGNQ
jgi:hypothetical protein